MVERPGEHRHTATAQQSTAELVRQLSEQTSRLFREELRLAQLEMRQKGKRAGIGAGLFGGAGLVALYGVGALVAALTLGLAEAMEPWIAALIVGVALLLVAGLLALVGRRQVQEATPPAPEDAMESVKQDIEVVKERARR